MESKKVYEIESGNVVDDFTVKHLDQLYEDGQVVMASDEHGEIEILLHPTTKDMLILFYINEEPEYHIIRRKKTFYDMVIKYNLEIR